MKVEDDLSTNHVTNQSAIQPGNQPGNQSVALANGHAIGQPSDMSPYSQNVHHPPNHPINQSLNQTANQLVNQSLLQNQPYEANNGSTNGNYINHGSKSNHGCCFSQPINNNNNQQHYQQQHQQLVLQLPSSDNIRPRILRKPSDLRKKKSKEFIFTMINKYYSVFNLFIFHSIKYHSLNLFK